MNSLILSFLIFFVFLFHMFIRTQIKNGKVREGLCAIWCIDAVFAICGSAVSFALYRYTLIPYLTWRNILICLVFLILTGLFFLLSPSGIRLLISSKDYTESEILMAEYRFNDTLCFVRGFFMLLLFCTPILMSILQQTKPSFLNLSTWKETDICGAFCFIGFSILVPMCLRQAFYWLKNLRSSTSAVEDALLKKYSTNVHFRKRNYFI